MPNSNDQRLKSLKNSASLPSSRSSVNTDDELSLDTRLAAQAILNDQEIGRFEPKPTRSNEPAPVIIWLQTRRVMLTLVSAVVCLSVGLAPLVIESNKRQTSRDLQDAVAEQALRIGKKLGHDKMAILIDQRNIRGIKEFYAEIRPSIAQQLNAQGFPVKEKQLKIRLDEQNKTLVLGAEIGNSDQGLRVVWAPAKGTETGRAAPPAGLSNVIEEDSAVLFGVATIELILLFVLWVVPGVYLRRQVG